MLKNKELMNKLLLALMIENNGSLSLKNLEIMMDNLINSHDVYPSFTDERTVVWNIEDHAKHHQESFVKTLNNMSKQNDLINICFSPRCDGCEKHLHKVSVTDMKFVMRCSTCSVEYVFEVVHSGNPVGSIIDSEESTSTI